MKLSAQLTNRPSFLMHQDQGLFNLSTVVDELHASALKVWTTSSAEIIARWMRGERVVLVSGLDRVNPSKTPWQTSRNKMSLAPNPLGLGGLGSTTSQGLARIAEYSHLGRDSSYPINFAGSRVVYRRLKMASAADFWLPRGNFVSSLPVMTEINPSRISSCTSSLNLSISDILRLTQLLSLPTKAAISLCVNPSSR